MQTILVPLDGSTSAEQVLPYVHILALLLHARVQLLQVVASEEAEPVLAESFAAIAGMYDIARNKQERVQEKQRIHYEQAAVYLASQAGRLWNRGFPIDVDVRLGNPVDTIIEAASQPEVAMVAMATHSDSGLHRWVRGSIADKVVHAVTKPVLLVRGSGHTAEHTARLKHILVPLDGSAVAADALPLATSLAQRANASLALVRAIVPTLTVYPAAYGRVAQPSYYSLFTTLHDQALTALNDICGELHHKGVRATPVVAAGNPAEVIVEEAQRRAADLIVIATHGYSGPRRWALGSVTDDVIHTSTTPVLLVHVGAA